MVREKFDKPEMEMVTFDAEDIIMTSGCTQDCGWNCTNDDKMCPQKYNS